jgi:streptomycin 6-kinase
MSAALIPWLERWGLALDGASPQRRYQGVGDTGQVAFVRRGDERLVLKLLPAGSDERLSGVALAHWSGEGAARLVEAGEGAILMERAVPGEELLALTPDRDEEATLIACEVMAKLNRPAPPPQAGFRRVEDWGRGFARNRPAALAAGMDGALIDRAEARFFDLCATQATPILLHGDFQHYNIIRDARRGWLAIDPKGILGEPAYEVGALLRNPMADWPADAAVIDRRTHLIAGRLGYPYQRLIGWTFAQWVLSVLWAIEDGIGFAPAWLAGPRAAEALL